MKNKMRKIVAGCLLGVMCLGSSFTTHASEKFTMPNGEIVEITQSEDVNLPVTRSLYESSSFALGSNQNYYSVEFNAKNSGSDPHTRFDLTTSDVSGGKWYATVKSNAGFEFTSSQYSGAANINVKNLRSDVKYEVTMYWVPGTNAVKGKYTMWTSY